MLRSIGTSNPSTGRDKASRETRKPRSHMKPRPNPNETHRIYPKRRSNSGIEEKIRRLDTRTTNGKLMKTRIRQKEILRIGQPRTEKRRFLNSQSKFNLKCSQISCQRQRRQYKQNMIILLSPAKTLDFESQSATEVCTQPDFLKFSKYLVNGLTN